MEYWGYLSDLVSLTAQELCDNILFYIFSFDIQVQFYLLIILIF